MAEWTEGTTRIEATPAEVMTTIADYEGYPEWAEGVQRTEVRARDDRGRPSRVHFVISQMGVGAEYTLTYTYRPDDAGVSWTSTEASGAVRDIEGEYVLEPDGEGTKVTYRTAVELAIKVPGFMKRQGERMVIAAALDGLKKRVEGG